MQAAQQYSRAGIDNPISGASRRRNKTRLIAFRLTEDESAQIERAALAEGEAPNNWCRRLTIVEAREGRGLPPTEHLCHKDIARVRYLMEATFGMLFGTDDRTDALSTKTSVDRQPQNVGQGFQPRY
jgi:hypothetical protein